MRVDSISIGPPDDPAVIQFHPRLTMVAGIGATERAEVIDVIIAALTSSGDDIQDVRFVDNTGRTITMRRDVTGTHFVDEEGTDAAGPLTLLGLDANGLRRLMLIEAADLAVAQPQPREDEAPEVREARASLATVDAQLAEALGCRARADACRAEVAAIDNSLVEAQTDGAKRDYARLLAELEQVRAESASARGGATVADADRRFVEDARRANQLAEQWRDAEERAEAERQRFGNRRRLDERALAEALATPDQVPAELEELARRYEAVEAHRAALDERLRRLADDHAAEPRHPAIVRLAHADQDLVWGTARRVLELAERLDGHSVALGGLGSDGVGSVAVADLEAIHDQVDRAERVVDDRIVPGVAAMAIGVLLALLGVVVMPMLSVAGAAVTILAGLGTIAIPRRRLSVARRREAEAFERAGLTSYLGLQYRRLEATINPAATEPLKLAATEYRHALSDWRALGGDIEPAEALDLEAETRAYVASMSGLQGVADQIHLVRTELVSNAEPAVAQVRQQLVEACAPFGIADPATAVGVVRQQAATGTLARLQRQLEIAEAAADEIRSHLEEELAALGFGDDGEAGGGGDLSQRLNAFDAGRAAARQREQVRRKARPPEVIEADLVRLEARVRTEHRPEWGTEVTPADIEEPDVESLHQRRRAVLAECTELDRMVPDVGRLTDRRDAMRRRVASLAERAGGSGASMTDAPGLEDRLLARLTAARSAGPMRETAPLVLNEPFHDIHGDRKSAILDTLERLSASVQLTYLTDDVEAIAWGRRRAATGAVSLLEPASEPAVS